MAVVGVEGAGAATVAGAVQVEALFRSEYPGLVRLASLLLGDVAASEEVVQDAFVRLQLDRGRIREPAKAPAWLRSVVLNGARSRLRRRAVRRRSPEPVPGTVPSAETGALAQDEHRRVVAALRRLPVRQREALALRFYLDLSEEATAAAMGVSAGSVKTHVHRGLATLAPMLREER
ncbi:MAG: SigE family RNA polymerase sigma factor [Acidimicrobiia bacterium]